MPGQGKSRYPGWNWLLLGGLLLGGLFRLRLLRLLCLLSHVALQYVRWLSSSLRALGNRYALLPEYTN